jgi:GDP-mannose 6-dehydrogenase
MRISVFGLGYVGAVTAACLAKIGHQVIGIDIDPVKVERINKGLSPIHEPGLDELIAEMVSVGSLKASPDAWDAVLRSEISMICVGTPSRPNGGVDLRYVRRVVREIGQVLNGTHKGHCVVLRSTVPPGTTAACFRELCDNAGRNSGITMVYYPEFLREGSALQDFFDPPYIVIGINGDYAVNPIADLYDSISGEVIVTSWETAELLKYANNAFHTLKIVFANEIGRIAKAMGVDPFEVMELVCRDTKLNISSAYLRPGFAYGGPCLPKDLRALIEEARFLGVELPLLESLPRSNSVHLASAMDLIRKVAQEANSKDIGLIGLAFKEGTDDLRESPSVELAERLLAYGYNLRVYDPHIDISALRGSAKFFVDQQIPDLPDILTDHVEQLISEMPVLVVAHVQKEIVDLIIQRTGEHQFIVDLTGKLRSCKLRARYYRFL